MANECPQCGIMHPALQPGETCPLTPIKDKEGNVIEFDDFLRQLKDIITSQIQSKGLKDQKKLFGGAIVEMTKFLETYKE